MWALGCLLYELTAQRPPFTATVMSELTAKINQGRFARIPFRYSDELNRVICNLLQVDVRVAAASQCVAAKFELAVVLLYTHLHVSKLHVRRGSGFMVAFMAALLVWLTWQEVKRPTVEELLKVPSIVQQLWALSDADPSLELSMSGAPQRSRHSASSGSDEG